MENSQTKKILIAIVVLAVLSGGSYFIFSGGGSGVQETGPAMTEEEQSISQNILALTDKLNTISIDSSFFGSILFTNLKDISAKPQEEPIGRPNPFAFIGTDGSGSAAPQTTIVLQATSTGAVKKVTR